MTRPTPKRAVKAPVFVAGSTIEACDEHGNPVVGTEAREVVSVSGGKIVGGVRVGGTMTCRAAKAPASLSFVVSGPPQPKERARRGKGGRWYTPERTRRYEAAVKAMAQLAVPRGWPMDARYSVTITAWFADGRHRDCDNILKACADAMQGVCYDNDRRVVEGIARRGGIDRESPRTIVEVRVVDVLPCCAHEDTSITIEDFDALPAEQRAHYEPWAPANAGPRGAVGYVHAFPRVLPKGRAAR